MNDSSVACREGIEDVSDDFGSGHLFELFYDIHEIHETETLLIVFIIHFLLCLQKTIDHNHVDFVVLVDDVFTSFDAID